MTTSDEKAAMKIGKRGLDIAMSAAMRNVLSPISETQMMARLTRSE